MLFQPAATMLFFSKRDQEAVHLLSFRLRGMLERLPEWLRSGLVADNDHKIELANGSVGAGVSDDRRAVVHGDAGGGGRGGLCRKTWTGC